MSGDSFKMTPLFMTSPGFMSMSNGDIQEMPILWSCFDVSIHWLIVLPMKWLVLTFSSGTGFSFKLGKFTVRLTWSLCRGDITWSIENVWIISFYCVSNHLSRYGLFLLTTDPLTMRESSVILRSSCLVGFAIVLLCLVFLTFNDACREKGRGNYGFRVVAFNGVN